MKSRLIASTIVGAAIVFATTGCTFITPQSTEIEYSASDGVNVPLEGQVAIRNAQIVATEDGAEGNFIAAFVNESDESATVNMEFGEGSSVIRQTVRIPANSSVSLGVDGEEPLLLEGLDTAPGEDIPGYFEVGDASSLISVPVLDGTLPYLEPYVP
ncbi:DNA modification methylase [Microbacterium hominis]|uniref:DNA modification methylase n=1 Tax=Microbacterium hominis TaxID=162426 RepID=A0A7D4QLP8_9MICO|nr:DNA modification methylase [Microbacterium hominis]